MRTAIRILLGAHRWQAWQGQRLLHDAVASLQTLPALIDALPPGAVTLWLDRPDEQVARCVIVAQRLRDQRRLLANQIQPPGALESGWGRWLNAGRALESPAWLLQLQSPTLLNQLAAALLAARHSVPACHSHTLALLTAPRGRHLYIAAGLLDGVRHIWVDGGVLRFTRLCPGTIDSPQASADVEATLQHLIEQQWWNGLDALACDSVVSLSADLLARYPQLHVRSWQQPAGPAAGDGNSEYQRPSYVVRHRWRTVGLRVVRQGTPLSAALALAYAGVALSAALRAPVPATTPVAADVARLILRQLPPQALSMPEQLRLLSLVLQQHPGPAVQALRWQAGSLDQAALTLDFADSNDPIIQPDPAWFTPTALRWQPGSTAQRWQLLAREAVR
ncbi:hypothetical protein [Amantichitinum ursilacus]|uniref:Uncharacterized protein n=1 Tax=Amantichitinum ursilacus TaxID=857265 RepID=A0A0N0XJR0_9NEIS|nr:hypothetical protein [Amantichitinum ursilacus]KPC54009.1 hypothetical protein WG78_05150 [Amantichitinum ursilacus]